MKPKRSLMAVIPAALMLMGMPMATAQPGQEVVYYVSIDSLRTVMSGSYAGRPNPNADRLSLFFAHYYYAPEGDPANNHFHGIATWRYTGPANSPVAVVGNDRLPEMSQRAVGQPSLWLRPVNSGPLAGRYVSGQDLGEYSRLTIRPVRSLQSSSDPDDASMWSWVSGYQNARWANSLNGRRVGLRLVNLAPGLSVTDANGSAYFQNIGDVHALGVGDGWSFDPYFSVPQNGAPLNQILSASFQLVDMDAADPAGSASGVFTYDFTPVPEPGAGIALGAGLAIMALARRRRERTS